MWVAYFFMLLGGMTKWQILLIGISVEDSNCTIK